MHSLRTLVRGDELEMILDSFWRAFVLRQLEDVDEAQFQVAAIGYVELFFVLNLIIIHIAELIALRWDNSLGLRRHRAVFLSRAVLVSQRLLLRRWWTISIPHREGPIYLQIMFIVHQPS